MRTVNALRPDACHWRQRAIQVVRAIVDLFERAWRELSHRPAPAPSDADEASNPSDAVGPASLG